jgi:hypothetical protein
LDNNISDFFFTCGNDRGIVITNAQSEIFYLQITGAQFRHYVNKDISIHECTCSLMSCVTSHIVKHLVHIVKHLVQCSGEVSHRRNYSGHTVLCGP